MTSTFSIELLGSRARTGFSCGAPDLDRYFREFVSQDIRRRISNCFVAIDDDGVIAGYYTLAATSLTMTELPADEARKLPRYPLLPAGLIGRLAVDHRFRGQGLGASLIIDAVVRSMRSEPAIFAIVVDAKDDTAASFYRHLGFRRFVTQPTRMFVPIAEAAKHFVTR